MTATIDTAVSYRLVADDLIEALKLLKPIITHRYGLEIAERVRIDFSRGKTTVTATNIDLMLTVELRRPAWYVGDDSIVVDYDHLLASVMPGSYVHLEVTDDTVTVVQNVPTETRVELKRYPTEEYLSTPNPPTAKPAFALRERDVVNLREVVMPATASDDSRPALQCVYFHPYGDYVAMEAADGYRLARTLAPYLYDREMTPFMIPADTLKKLPRRIYAMRFTYEPDADYAMADIQIKATKDRFIHARAFLKVKPGYFPDLNTVIPQDDELTTEIRVHRRIIEEAANAKIGKRLAYLVFRPGEVRFELEGAPTRVWEGDQIQFVSLIDGEEPTCQEYRINPVFCREMVKVIQDSEIRFRTISPRHAVKVTNFETTFVVMPMVVR